MGLSEYNLNRSSLFSDTGFINSHYLDEHGVLKPAYLIEQNKKNCIKSRDFRGRGYMYGIFYFFFLFSRVVGIHIAAEHVFLRKQTKNLVLCSS